MPRVRREFSVKHWEPLPEGTEHVTPAPAVCFTGPAPVTEYVDTSPAVTCAAPAPVIEYAEPAVTDTTPAPVNENVALTRVVLYVAPAPVIEYTALERHGSGSSERIRGSGTCRFLCSTIPYDRVCGVRACRH